MIRYPFQKLQTHQQKNLFILFLALTLLLLACLYNLDIPLKTEAAPKGIISFEFAEILDKSKEIMHSWGQEGRIYAGISLGLDYLYLFSYSITIALGCLLIGKIYSKRFPFMFVLGAIIAWAQFFAAFLDSLENFALIRLLLNFEQEYWSAMAFYCAGPKFAIVLAGLAFVFIGGIGVLFYNFTSKKK